MSHCHSTGHGIGGKGVYYIPVREEKAGTGATPCAEIWAVNVGDRPDCLQDRRSQTER